MSGFVVVASMPALEVGAGQKGQRGLVIPAKGKEITHTSDQILSTLIEQTSFWFSPKL